MKKSKKYPLEAKKWEEDWKNLKIPKGEKGSEFYQRVSRWIDTIIKKQQKGAFLIATHGGCIRVILSHLVAKGLMATGIFMFKQVEWQGLKLIKEFLFCFF
jgi:alpha-ribazole phosphatase